MQLCKILLVFCAVLLVGARADGADGLYANLSAFIEANKDEIARLGSTPEPAVLPSPFPCQLIHVSSEVPTSVHRLRPSDINVVAALGDSITAAFGAEARTALSLFTEYRGVSWSAGGRDTYETVVTMPNILKQFNPLLYGYSIGNGGAKSSNAVFNVAVSGATAPDLPGQARELVSLLANSPQVNFSSDWKVITIWIGGNDLCAVCNEPEKYSAGSYQDHLLTTLTILQEIPRVYVNLVQILDVSRLHELQEGLCDSFHKTVCPCVQNSDETREIVARTALEYQAAGVEIGKIGRLQTDTFAVNVQPMYINTQIPRKEDGTLDRSYFAPDCFHFSYKAHAAAAIGLWNNMMQPEGSKAQTWELGQPPRCPTQEVPYLCTPTNVCGASSGVQDGTPTGGVAPPPTLTVEQRTMVMLALVLIVAVPAAMVAIRWHRRRRAAARQGYTPIDGVTTGPINEGATTSV